MYLNVMLITHAGDTWYLNHYHLTCFIVGIFNKKLIKIYCILEWNIKGTIEMINMLANHLRVLHFAIRLITTAFLVQSQWETRPQCDIRFITTVTHQRCWCPWFICSWLWVVFTNDIHKWSLWAHHYSTSLSVVHLARAPSLMYWLGSQTIVGCIYYWYSWGVGMYTSL